MAKISLYLKGSQRERGRHLDLEGVTVGASRTQTDAKLHIRGLIQTEEDTYSVPHIWLEFSVEETKQLISDLQKSLDWTEE
jgi:hypothetical protein